MTIYVIQRHGKTGKAASDIERQLTDQGRAQAEAMQQLLTESRLNGGDVVLSSIAQRAIDTVKLDGDVVALPELYTPGGADGEEMDRLSGLLGYGTLRAYLAADTVGVFARWAEAARTAVQERTAEARFARIGCHAVLANALALALLPEDEHEARNLVLDTSLGEAECIVLELASSRRGSLAEQGFEIASSQVAVRIFSCP